MELIKKIVRFFVSGYSECAKCKAYPNCSHNPYIHRSEDYCNYGKIHGK